MKTIYLEKIISEDNRKYTKDEGFEQLVNSIKEVGVIEPPVVREVGDGTYKIIAGRRRIAAVRKLAKGNNDAQVNCAIIPVEDPRSDDDIALAENVNRQAMHPLDEAALFFKLECRGLPVKEIAKLYARSPQDIYKRLRLMRLTEDLKIVFRENMMDIEAAAIIAELPEDDQNDFYVEQSIDWENWKDHPDIYDEKDKTNGATAVAFVQKKQKYKIKKLMKGCADCKNRTHNTDNSLFTEYDSYDDVCLDAECYRKKWYAAIEKALNEQIKSGTAPADYKILFDKGVPAELYKKASSIEFNGTKCDVLKPAKYEFTHGETDRKKDACWRIREHGDGQITVERIGYKAKEKADKEKGVAKPETKTEKEYTVKKYSREVLEAVANERGVAVTEIVKELNESKFGAINFHGDLEKILTEKIITMRIESDKPHEYLPVFLDYMQCTEKDSKYGKYIEKLTGHKSFMEISKNLTDNVQKLFHYLFLLNYDADWEELPDLDDVKKIEPGEYIFFDYSGLTKEEYTNLYIQTGKEEVVKILKKGKPKAELVKHNMKTAKGKPKAEDEPDPDMGIGDESDKAD